MCFFGTHFIKGRIYALSSADEDWNRAALYMSTLGFQIIFLTYMFIIGAYFDYFPFNKSMEGYDKGTS